MGQQRFQEALQHVKEIQRYSNDLLDGLHQGASSEKQGETIDALRYSLRSVGSYIQDALKLHDMPVKDPVILQAKGVLKHFEEEALPSDITESQEYESFCAACRHAVREQQGIEIEREQDKKIATSFLDSLVEVKRDRNYEFFFLRNEDNKKYYTEVLLQIIAKHGKLYEQLQESDPFIRTIVWDGVEREKESVYLCSLAEPFLKSFYKSGALEHKDILEVKLVHYAAMALMLSKSSNTSVHKGPVKSNVEYFKDFLSFLREALTLFGSSDTNEEEKPEILKQAKRLVSEWVIALHEYKIEYSAATQYLYHEIGRKMEAKSSVMKYLADIYDEQHRKLSRYPNGPLLKAIDYLSEKESRSFDPMLMGMLPSVEGTLEQKSGEKVLLMRSAAPIIQESILYAALTPEFCSFLECLEKEEIHLLVVNFQNRCIRRDKVRVRLLEESSERMDFSKNFQLISCPEPEDLLENLEISGEIEDFDTFLSILEADIFDEENSSYNFSPALMEVLKGGFLKDCFSLLKEVFFSKKKILFRNDKLLLLHIVSYLIVFKSLEVGGVNRLWIMTKDGLDFALVFLAGLAGFSKEVLNWTEKSVKLLLSKITAPSFVLRDRQLFPCHIELLEKLLGSLKKNRKNLTKLKHLFSFDIEGWVVKEFLAEATDSSEEETFS